MVSKSFRDLVVWQKAHACVLGVYKMTRTFPKEELFVLTAQFRRAAISVPANISEGFKRRTKPAKITFYNNAQSSLEECRYFLILAHDLKYADTTRLSADYEEVSRMLEAYVSRLEGPDEQP